MNETEWKKVITFTGKTSTTLACCAAATIFGYDQGKSLTSFFFKHRCIGGVKVMQAKSAGHCHVVV
jgi:hypothetical protein